MFDDSPALDNLDSQAMAINRGAGSKWTAMERDWRNALTKDPPSTVTDIEIQVLYDGSRRPSGFDINYKVDDDSIDEHIPNPVPGMD